MKKLETALPYKNKGELIKFLKAQKFDCKLSLRANPADKATAWKFDRLVKALKLITESPDFHPGYCIKCKIEIPQKRLLILPETIWCIECSRKISQKKPGWLLRLNSMLGSLFNLRFA